MNVMQRILFRVMDIAGGEGGGSAVAVERPETISEDDWNDLSEEEREGVLMDGTGELGEVIEEGEDGPTPEELAAIAGEDEGEGGEGAGEGEGEGGEGEAAAGASVAAEGEAPAVVVTGDFPTDEELLAFRPTVNASELKIAKIEVPSEITAKIIALDAKEDELEERFDNAEITKDEYRKEMRGLTRERDALKTEGQDAVFELKQQARDNARMQAEDDRIGQKFLASRPYYEEKDDKGETTMKSDALFGALEKSLAKVTKSNPAMPYMQRLLLADKAVKDAFGMKESAKPAKEEKKPVKPPAQRPTHKTLSDVPAAAKEDTGTDPFAYLDRLSGEKLENAIEKLSPSQRAAYEGRY